jgi:pyridoxamine 5'-phosphate oxidase
MDKNDIMGFLRRNPVAFLATCEGNKPHVRGMLMYRADDNGIILHTGKSKDLQKQLENNPEVELCFFSQQENKQIRVSGRVQEVQDEALKKEIVENRTFMKPWIEKHGLAILTVWRLKSGKATVWTMESNFAPKSYVQL